MKNLDSTFSEEYATLLRLNMQLYLPELENKSPPLSSEQITSLLGNASILSLSNSSSDIARAYEVCSRLLELFGDQERVVTASDVIFSRIGNFPGRSLLRRKFTNDAQPSTALPLKLERLAREIENTIADDDVQLTDFQYKLYEDLAHQKSLSVSAPTSAGKSYILNLDLIRRLRAPNKGYIIYIVPTRALVSEVSARVRETIRHQALSSVIVRTAPFAINDTMQHSNAVFVLTQERLMRLLSQSTEQIRISALIIDEAHELQKGKRGIILQNSIDLALSKNPDATILFASPLISNPGYFLSLFQRLKNGSYFTEEISPVSQNIVLISEVSRKPEHVAVSLLSEGSEVNVGVARLGFRFRGATATQKANFAKEVCKSHESLIIFADSASSAEATALALAELVEPVDKSDEISDFVDFIRSEIHGEYPLIQCLARGVGFHYGDMPSIVRSGIEKLFKENKIRYICCTSTLLQGVNLPAKHIVIEDPRLGTEPMKRADFRNLAGRAGRLLKEFHGNIWCLRPGDWLLDSYKGDNLQEISSAMNSAMRDGGSLVTALLSENVDAHNRDFAETVYSRLYHELHGTEGGRSKVEASYGTENNKELLNSNIEKLLQLEITVPKSILDAHQFLRPDHLQKLFELIQQSDDIDDLVLIRPYEAGGKRKMQQAIWLINEAFDLRSTERRDNWVAVLAHKWAWGTPIGDLIRDRVDYIRGIGKSDSASSIIRGLLQTIEREIRYNLVKYFAAFEDILRHVLIERKKEKAAEDIAPYHIFLEFGSCNQAVLSLMALGLSRFTATKVNSVMSWANPKEPEDYLKEIAKKGIARLKLPRLCENELIELIGP